MSINSKESRLQLRCFVPSMQNNRGFTLVELIVVSAIIGILASMTLITISDFKNKTKAARTAAEIRGLEKDIFAYASEKGSFPDSALVSGMENLKNMLDPWGNSYVYVRIDVPVPAAVPRTFIVDINTDFDLYSKGPDGLSTDTSIDDPTTDGYDDIVRGIDGSFVGTGAQYGL